MTKVTVQPVWEYPDDYCKTQTQEFDKEPAGGNCGISSNVRKGSHFECAGSNSCSCASLASGCSHSCSNFGRRAATGHEAAYSSSGIGEGQSQHHSQVSMCRGAPQVGCRDRAQIFRINVKVWSIEQFCSVPGCGFDYAILGMNTMGLCTPKAPATPPSTEVRKVKRGWSWRR